MNFNDLLSWDSSLTLEKSQLPEQSFQKISLFENAESNNLCFIKDKAFYKKWQEQASTLKSLQLGLIVDKKLFTELPQEERESIYTLAGTILTSPHVPITMCKISKPFHQALFEKDLDLIDGRQMGSATIDPRADIAQNVFIAQGVSIGARSIIHAGVTILSNVQIGEDVEIFPNTVIYQNCIVGNRVRLHSGVVIGADGFGYEFADGAHHKIWHLGNVVLHDDVEIGSLTTIDRGTFSSTVIGAGTKIDNQVQIGHNCRVGRGVIICGQSGLSGSAVVGDFTVIGGKAGVGPGVQIGMACQVAGSAMVTGNLADKSVVAGHPARPLREWMKGVAYVRKESLK